ncbi:hypothetical protein [Rhodococcus sp. SGAir0479]|uniref:hypothetical protein n=1 Tax=Rhodococcus sp. SGAir0479 TaxID=2567884 RepID=UPI0010CD6A00|nr:hypothetical protein [Rhodococcus sp. SGAir0479]QCQ93120.1 hypothetical protein E7742_19120 [Rhodococcus sp. SGAir0479]
MSRRLSWLARIGGDAAVTRWSWLLTAPFAVTVMGSYISARGPRDWPTCFSVAVVVHLVMGIALLIAWLTFLRPGRRRSRPAVALAFFGALGGSRPLLFDALLAAQGLPTDSRPLGTRLLINVTAVVIALSLIAITVDSVHRHDAVMRRLRTARAALVERRRSDEEYLAGLARRCADDLSARIDAALTSIDPTTMDREGGARLLRGISEDIVRPMSHALFDDVTPAPEPVVEVPTLTWRDRRRGVLQAVRPVSLTVPVLLYTAVILSFLVTGYGARETVLQVIGVLVTCVVGNAVVARVTTPIAVPVRRVASMAAGYSVVAVATAAVFWLILGGNGFPPAFVVPGIAFYPFAAMATCLIVAANEQRASEEKQLADALGEQSRDAAEVHARVIAARRRLAHVLHSSVQGELVATALAMRGGPGVGVVAVGDLIGRVLREVGEDRPHEAGSGADAEQQITELIGMWSAAVPVTTEIDPRVWSLLSGNPVRLDHAVDVVSEGFTNAIRHGTGGALQLRMTVDPRTSVICIGIRSPGRVAPDRGAGLGLASLSSRVGTTELVEEPESVLLSVRLD